MYTILCNIPDIIVYSVYIYILYRSVHYGLCFEQSLYTSLVWMQRGALLCSGVSSNDAGPVTVFSNTSNVSRVFKCCTLYVYIGILYAQWVRKHGNNGVLGRPACREWECSYPFVA